MPFSGSGNSKSSGESISHFNAVRLRINGEGTLLSRFISLDEIETQELASIAMQSLTNREPRLLANFQQQRAMYEISTEEINDYFKINRIVVFASYLWNEWPG